MWLNRILNKTIYHLATRFKDRREDIYISGLLESLDPKSFKSLNDNNTKLISILLVYQNILIYIQKIMYCNTIMIEGVPIPLDWCRYDYRNSDLSSFLRDDKGNYIDSVKFINEFKIRLTIFLDEYNKQMLHEDFTRKYNARVLTEFRRHLLDVTETLIRSSI